ncbi:MAG: ferric iron uptake transcriptional regulator [Gammaproteobacteria bacterium]
MSEKELRGVGLKVTLPRKKILQLLEEASDRHLSAEEIFNQLRETGEDIGLATVYRVLAQFCDAGLAIRRDFQEGFSVFELEQGEHHDHLVCVNCGKVVEFVDEIIEQRQMAIAKEKGFTITDHSLNLYGKCQRCG